MAGISITVSSAPLSEGWEGTPDEFRQQIFSTVTFDATGSFLTGQIGGATPTSDVGLYVSGQQLYTWDADTSTYKPITTVPVGAVIPYLGAVAPDVNYLLCDGGDYLRDDYPELFEVIGTTYNLASDASDSFRLPDLRGRTFFGAGIGDYNPLGTGTLTGKMKELTLGEYGGREWPNNKTPRHVNEPAASKPTGDALNYGSVGTGANYTRSVPPYVACNWMVRAK